MLLRKDIREKRIPANKEWEDVYRDHFCPEFVVGESPEEAHCLFKDRLETACDYVSKKEAHSAEEEAAMLHDRAVCPLLLQITEANCAGTDPLQKQHSRKTLLMGNI